MIRFSTFVVLFACTLLPAWTAAQATKGIEPGERVSVYAPSVSERPTVGRVQSIDATGMRLGLEDGSSLNLSRNDIRQMYVSRGMRSHTLTGTGIGALSGLALGATVAIIGSTSDSDDPLDSLDRAVYTAFAVITTASGAVAGTIIGALTRSERWDEVMPSDVSWGLTPTLEGGMRVGVALRF